MKIKKFEELDCWKESRGLSQIIYKTPRRLTILHFEHLFLMEGETFIITPYVYQLSQNFYYTLPFYLFSLY